MCTLNERNFFFFIRLYYFVFRVYQSMCQICISFCFSAHFILHLLKTDSTEYAYFFLLLVANRFLFLLRLWLRQINKMKTKEKHLFSWLVSHFFASLSLRAMQSVVIVYSKHRKIRFGSQLRGRKEISMLLFALDFHLSCSHSEHLLLLMVFP